MVSLYAPRGIFFFYRFSYLPDVQPVYMWLLTVFFNLTVDCPHWLEKILLTRPLFDMFLT